MLSQILSFTSIFKENCTNLASSTHHLKLADGPHAALGLDSSGLAALSGFCCLHLKLNNLSWCWVLQLSLCSCVFLFKSKSARTKLIQLRTIHSENSLRRNKQLWWRYEDPKDLLWIWINV